MEKKAGTSTILVIEDYTDSRTLLSSLLRAKGYKVVEARDGKEGLLQANRVTPDLILMDLAMHAPAASKKPLVAHTDLRD